jgi:hypothetical protein
MKKTMVISLVAVVLVVCLIGSVGKAKAAKSVRPLRVGVYDSRGIAIAYMNSERWDKILKEKLAALEQAKKANDTEKVKELEAWGPAAQEHAHQQGFGMAPVHEYLEVVKDQIPSVAKAAGVEVIVSKWELDYLAPDAETADVTMELAKLFNPREKAYQWIEQMKDQKPIDSKELQRLEKEDPNF